MNDRFPDKSVRIQNSLELAEVEDWTKSIEAGEPSSPLQPLKNLDYDRYGAGEAELAWLDTEIGITIDHGSVTHVVEELLESIDRNIRSKGWAIGHLKFVLNDGTEQAKISFTTLSDANWKERLPKLGGENLSLLINARVATSADGLKKCIGSVIDELAVRREFRYESRFSDSFHPGYPVPTHRVKADSPLAVEDLVAGDA